MTVKDCFLFSACFFFCMDSSNGKYSLDVFGSNREAWLHGDPAVGNVPSVEVRVN